MADTKTLKARTLQKRDTSANWTKANPIILNGEIIIVETESGEIRKKIGDGIKTYTELPFDDEVVKNLINDNKQKIAEHTEESIVSNDGVHGFRYNIKNEAFEVFSEDENGWLNLDEAGSIGEPLSVSLVDFDIVRSFSSVYIMWKEPDYIGCSADWGSTVIVRKEGGIPENPKDGVVVYETTSASDFNAFSEQPYMDPEVIDYTKTYGYRIFPKSTQGVYNKNFNFGKLLSPITPSQVLKPAFFTNCIFPDPWSIQVNWSDGIECSQSISCGDKTVTVEKYQWGKTTLIWSIDGFKTPENGGGIGSATFVQKDQYSNEPFTITGLDPDTDYYLTVTAEDWRGVEVPPSEDYLCQHKIHTTKIDSSLDKNSWSTISAVSQRGEAANYWAVGDCKEVSSNENPDVTKIGTLDTVNLWNFYVYILGFDHNNQFDEEDDEDSLRVGEGSGITFGCFKVDISGTGGLVDICLCDRSYYGETISDGTKAFNMNHWTTDNYNIGGWAACDLRYDVLGSTDTPPDNYGTSTMTDRQGYDASTTTATNPVPNTFMAALPSDLREVMKPIKKKTAISRSDDTMSILVTIDYLPLLSAKEVFGNDSSLDTWYTTSFEGVFSEQYAYYKAGNPKSKYGEDPGGSSSDDGDVTWLLRTEELPFRGNTTTRFGAVDENGEFTFTTAVGGLAPIFLV